MIMKRSFLIQSVQVEEKAIIFDGVIIDGVQADSPAQFVLDNQLQRPDVQSILEKIIIMPNALFRIWRKEHNMNFEQAIKTKVVGKIFLIDFLSPNKVEKINKYLGVQDPYLGRVSDMMKTYQIEAEKLQSLCQKHFFVSSYKFLTPENKEDLLIILQDEKILSK